jgi:2-dehydro-3-deoxygluconokinase
MEVIRMKKVITLGEILLRLSTPRYERFIQTDSFDVEFGGGESNVAISLANYGCDAYFVSKLPENEIGQAAINSLRRYGVNTEYIVRGGERVGIYYLEPGISIRSPKIIYDRSYSSISEADVNDFDFDEIFKDADWFHFTGITLALSDKAIALTEEALKAAKRHNVTISIDINYRKSLWTLEEAKNVIMNLMQYIDVYFGNDEDVEKILEIKPRELDRTTQDFRLARYKDLFEQAREKYNLKYIVGSLRESYSASDNGWSACAYDGNEFYQSRKYDINIVDRVGGGDSLAAGIIYGLLEGKNLKDSLEFGVAASALKHTIFGDFNMVTVDEVEALIKDEVI